MASSAETTAAPNSTTLASEVSSPVPDEAGGKVADSSPVAADTNTPPVAAGVDPAARPEKVEQVAHDPIQELWALVQAQKHPEIWGVTLAAPATSVPTRIILQKYLNANDGDLAKAKQQLSQTLQWRAQFKPAELLKKKFDPTKFANLGFVTTYGGDEAADAESKEVFTWNIYGSVKNMEATFGDLTAFIQWRVALMELALQALGIEKATTPITVDFDPYKITQVHDYKSISFLRQSPLVKSASTETIKVFAQNYPELLKEKFFVNVPAIMGFIYAFMKLFVAQKTIKKFHPMSNGMGLVHEFPNSKVKNLGAMLPKAYGGQGAELAAVGKQPALDDQPAAS